MQTARVLLAAFLACCISAFGADTTPARPGMVRLPLIDKQDIHFISLSVRGVPFRERVLAMAQDNYGFLWFGTDEGLYRYDGYTLKPYRHDPNNPRSLSDDIVKVVYKDRAGILWIGTEFGGLNRLDPAQDTLKRYQHDDRDIQSLAGQAVESIYQDAAGSLWIGTSGGVDRLDVASGRFFHYPISTVFALYEDRQGTFWVGTDQGLYTFDRSNGRFSKVRSNSIASSGLGNAFIAQLKQDRSGTLWVTSPRGNGLNALDPATGELRRYSFNSAQLGTNRLVGANRIFEDHTGVMWIGTFRDGLLQFDRDRKSLIRYSTDPDSGLPQNVWGLFEDSEGNMWVGSEAGVSRFRTSALPFVNHLQDPHDPSSLRNRVLSVHADMQGFLWIGTEGGLHRFDRRTGQVALFQHDSKDLSSISHNEVTAIREDGSGGLWIGTRGGGLNHFDRASQRFLAYRHDPNDPQSLSSDLIRSLWVDREGTLWVGTHDRGLNRCEAASGHFKSYRHDPRIPQSLSDDIVRVIFRDRAGTLWIGTRHGLNRFDRDTGRFTAYLHNASDPASLSHDGINSIYEDHQGTLWVGTFNGLSRLDRNRDRFEAITAADGLANDSIQAIQEDGRGHLWLATHEGLSDVDPQTKTIHKYSEEDGLLGDFANPTSEGRSCVTPEGELVFGSKHGITVFSPHHVSANPFRPPVVLTDFLLFNKSVVPGRNSPLQHPIWATHSVTLNYKENFFAVEFAALSFMAPDRNRYRYKLEGLEQQWNEVDGQRRVATYTSLAPATYVFRVQGSNNDLLWSEAGARLEITVLPPWWGTWWFRSLAFLGLATVALAVYRSRVRSLRLTAAQLELQVAHRTRELQIARDSADAANQVKSAFLANMSHELRTPLNAILGFSNLLRNGEVSEKQRKDLDIINRSGEHLLSLINGVLDLAKVEAGRTELQVAPCDVRRLVREIVEMMRARANEKNLEIRLIESAALPRWIQADAVKLRQVLLNLAGNAIKFTENGFVEVRLTGRTADVGKQILLTFEVEDTGIGIAPDDQQRIFDAFVQASAKGRQKGTGLGLTISRQFVELMGGAIHVESMPGKGSRFRVDLPVEPAEPVELMSSEAERGRIVGLVLSRSDLRVLIVEDGEENRLVLHRLMEQAGFQVRLAEDGAQGVETFQSWRPHFIWMDLRMPVMDGKEAIRRIRALDGGLDVKIAALTASAFISEREEVLAVGVDDFIRKPYQQSEIFDCMARHLGLRPIYEKVSHQERSVPLSKEDLHVLPHDLIRELAAVVVTVDSRRIREVIARISDCDRTVGYKLTHLADRYAYTAILELVDADEQSQEV